MDIAGLSTAMATNSLLGKVNVAVLSKTMDLNEELGAGMVQMIDAAAMERSVNPSVGGNFDMSI